MATGHYTFHASDIYLYVCKLIMVCLPILLPGRSRQHASAQRQLSQFSGPFSHIAGTRRSVYICMYIDINRNLDIYKKCIYTRAYIYKYASYHNSFEVLAILLGQ